ncbi:MAG: hypothetical protein KDC34_11395 [Saprospiraceae bacterium]|nr:hypothetical protein [Saprospiraceae bacterium]
MSIKNYYSPLSGRYPWAVLLVSFRGSEPHPDRKPASYYRDMFSSGTGGLYDYWQDVSYNNINIEGTRVYGWRTLSLTLEEFRALGRREKIYEAAKEFRSSIDFEPFYGIILIPDQNIEDAGSVGVVSFALHKRRAIWLNKDYGTVLANIDIIKPTFLAHEMGHGMHFKHSFDDSCRKSNTWSAHGEYFDSWDIMSAMNVKSFTHPMFGDSGPGLNAPYTYARGWLSEDLIGYFPWYRQEPQDFLLDSMGGHMHRGYKKAIKIDYKDSGTGETCAYWVELRTPQNWDQGIGENAVLIRQVKNGISYLISTDLTLHTHEWAPGKVFTDAQHNIEIIIKRISSGTDPLNAQVKVRRYISNIQEVPGTLGWEHQGAGVALGKIDRNARMDMVIFYIDNPRYSNKGYYRIGKNLSSQGVPASWTEIKEVPGRLGWENQGGGVALGDINGDGKLDMVIMYIDNPNRNNKAFYRIAWSLDDNGDPASWSEPIEFPFGLGWENQGGDICLADISGTGKLDLIIYYIDNPSGGNAGYYRIGWDLNENGIPSSWSEPRTVGMPFGWENQGGGISVISKFIDGRVQNDLLIFDIDNPSGNNYGFLTVGKDLSTEGYPASWSDRIRLAQTFGEENQGGSIATARISDDFSEDLMVYYIENLVGVNKGYFRVIHDVQDLYSR